MHADRFKKAFSSVPFLVYYEIVHSGWCMAVLVSSRKLARTSFSVEYHAMLQFYCHHGMWFADKGHMDVMIAGISGVCIPQ